MKYRIEYADGGHYKFVDGSKALIKTLQSSKAEEIADVRKLFKGGRTDSVLESYRKYMK